MDEAKRFAKQQRSNVDIALACLLLLFALRANWLEKSPSCYSGELLAAADRCKNVNLKLDQRGLHVQSTEIGIWRIF